MSDILKAMAQNFLGNSPKWYKQVIVAFLLINPILFSIDPFVAGWVLVVEFIFTLAMALKCYPLTTWWFACNRSGHARDDFCKTCSNRSGG